MIGQRVGAKRSKLGKLSKAYLFGFFLASPFPPLEIRVLLCSRYGEDTSHMRVYDLL